MNTFGPIFDPIFVLSWVLIFLIMPAHLSLFYIQIKNMAWRNGVLMGSTYLVFFFLVIP